VVFGCWGGCGWGGWVGVLTALGKIIVGRQCDLQKKTYGNHSVSGGLECKSCFPK